jgi:predicted AAA+ superfamily ATPase
MTVWLNSKDLEAGERGRQLAFCHQAAVRRRNASRLPAGDAGLKLVAEAEAARTSPGSNLLVDVLKLAGPSIVLLDELVMFARQLPDERFEAFLSFIQSLTEAAALVPHALIIGSLPESDAEAGGDKGKAALLRLEKVFGRVQSPWLPATGDENSAEFPPEAKEVRYQELLRLSYPIHPELFDRIIEGLGEPGKIPADPWGAPVYGECRRRVVAGPGQ